MVPSSYFTWSYFPEPKLPGAPHPLTTFELLSISPATDEHPDLASPVLYHLSSLSSLLTGQAALNTNAEQKCLFQLSWNLWLRVNEEALSILSCSSPWLYLLLCARSSDI